ncbi:MAG TPA: SRPBCC family protein [Mycobacteriales bacterium]|nr:SRPBCC family protein [Mycobacteriales bacterium]
MRDSVTVHFNAPPARVWELVSDVTRIGEFSPETFEAKWVGGASSPAVGARFRGHVKRNGRGPVYWTTCRATECVAGERFTFDVLGPGDRVLNTWSYRLATAGNGTDVTESFALADNLGLRLCWALAGWARGRTNRAGMRRTLESMKAIVEAG